MSPPTLQSARSSARRWRFASGFLFFGALTVVAGYYVPLRRETARLRSDAAQLRRELDQTQRELAAELTRPREAVPARPAAATPASLSLTPGVPNAPTPAAVRPPQEEKGRVARQRIERLQQQLAQRFGELERSRQLSVSSAGDRVSVAVASSRLFLPNTVDMGAKGRSLLCELSEQIMSEYQGQLRVTGYYGKPQISEPALQRRHKTPWELSAARAARCVDVLVRECKAPAERFLAVGYGPRAAGPLGENVAFEFIVGDAD